MKIDLNQPEIEDALVSFITTQGIDLSQKKVEVSLTAGRGPNGFTASVDIIKVASTPAPNVGNEKSDFEVDPPEEDDEADGADPIFADA